MSYMSCVIAAIFDIMMVSTIPCCLNLLLAGLSKFFSLQGTINSSNVKNYVSETNKGLFFTSVFVTFVVVSSL